MIVEARVVKSFKHTNTGIVWFEGDVFKGTDGAAAQLAEMGFLDFDGRAPMKPEQPDLATLTVSELRALCADRGIKAARNAKKADLVATLEGGD